MKRTNSQVVTSNTQQTQFDRILHARGTTWDGLSGQFFSIFFIDFVCFVVAIFDLVHNVEAILHINC